jgi:serine/threonine protein phosphatase PrpC
MSDALPVTGVARVTAAAASDRGRVRDGNEDRVFVDVPRGIFVVVDGVGGHAAGEVAATIAVDVIAQRLSRPLWSPEQRVREAIALANNEILTQASGSAERAGMTCVLTLALLTERGVTIGHVGDTRLYQLDANGMKKLTHDHSPVGEREDAGELTETEAMRHSRRNEVFRDVGSAFHAPADPDFIEIVEVAFDECQALLLCSDGLTDMVSAATIERLVRQHAGDPQLVAEGLILAANEAGGKDNVSVIYVEGVDFARGAVATLAPVMVSPTSAPDVNRAAARLLMTRGAWLVAGLLAGLGLGLALAWMLTLDDPVSVGAPRTLHVDQAPGSEYTTIAAAMAAASPRDTVAIGPGEYAEAVVLSDGVNLEASEPGSVTLVAPPAAAGWIALRADGRLGQRISGVRILGDATRPIGVGIRLAGHELHVADVTIEGTVDVGVDVLNDGAISVRTSRLTGITGLPARVSGAAHPRFDRNVFVRLATGQGPALDVTADATPELKDNVFIGYPEVLTTDAGRRDQLLQGNLIVGPTPSASAPSGSQRGQAPRTRR